MHHWQAWAPILARVAATGLALLGLAGIGLAARGSTDSGGLASASLTAGLAQLAGASAGVVPASPAGASAPAPVPPVPCAPTAAPSAEKASAPAAPTSPAITADGRVVLNGAGVAELQRLPGIGAKRAAAIVELRQRLGRFRRASELLRIKGIGPKTLERMLPKLVLDDG